MAPFFYLAGASFFIDEKFELIKFAKENVKVLIYLSLRKNMNVLI